MKKSAFISDILFAFFASAIFSLCLFRYFALSLPLAFFLALICGLLLAAAVWAILQTKRKNFFLKKSDETQKQRLLLHLALLSEEQTTDFFLNILSKTEQARKFSRCYLSSPERFYCIKCNFQPATSDEIARFYRLKTAKQRILFCLQIEEAAFQLCHRLDIQVKTGEELYRLVKENDAFPSTFLGETEKEKKYKKQLQLCFAKTNSKRFLGGASLILLTSLFTPFSYYYLVFGSILLLTAALIRIFGYD